MLIGRLAVRRATDAQKPSPTAKKGSSVMANATLRGKPDVGPLLYKRSFETLLVAVILAFVGCGEKGQLPTNQAEMGKGPRRCIPCVNTAPRMDLSVATEANESPQKCEKITTANPTLTLKELASELKELADTEGLTNDCASQLLEKHLGSASFADAFSWLSSVMISSDVDGRIAALTVLSILKGEWRATEGEAEGVQGIESAGENIAEDANGIPDEDINAGFEQDLNSPTAEKDDVEQRAVYAMMTLGLQDDNAAVRDAAYETLLTLPYEERSSLSLQLMGNDDVSLKERLLSSCAGDDSEFARNVNFQGLDATELSVRTLAENNVKQLVGRSFVSSDEAFAWYEQQISVGK